MKKWVFFSLWLICVIAFTIGQFLAPPDYHLMTNNPWGNLFGTSVVLGIIFFCLMVIFFIFEKKKPKRQLAYSNRIKGRPVVWFLLVTIVVLLISNADLRSKMFNFILSDSASNSSGTTPPSNCNEQESLAKVKNCTVLVLRDDGGHGSGFLFLGSTGFIVTNRHVIEGAKKLSTWHGKEEPLTLWGYSEDEDIAVLKTEVEFPTCNWANSQNIGLAETLYAVGWPNQSYGESSVTKGIFSRFIKTKEGAEFIQTDAALNPGNSGGPLVNKCGVVGINTTKVVWSDQDTPSEGSGFAYTSEYIKPIIDKLILEGSPKQLPVGQISSRHYSSDPGEAYDNKQPQRVLVELPHNGFRIYCDEGVANSIYNQSVSLKSSYDVIRRMNTEFGQLNNRCFDTCLIKSLGLECSDFCVQIAKDNKKLIDEKLKEFDPNLSVLQKNLSKYCSQ